MTRVAALLLLAAVATAQEPARLMPADTFLFLEADAAALRSGLRELDVAKILSDRKFRSFFLPGFRKLQLDPDDPVGSAIKKLELERWLAGRAAVGVRGISVAFNKRPRNTITPDEPLGVAVLTDLFGTVLSSVLREGRGHVDLRVDLDFAAVLEPGPDLAGWLRGFLNNPPFPLKKRFVQLGEHQLLHLTFPPVSLERNVYFEPQFYLATGEKRWIAATDAQVVAKMLAGGPRASLATVDAFASTRARLTSGRRLLYGWLDARRAVSMASKLVPPIVVELLEKSGLASVRGAGLGISVVEGGVRESVGLTLDGDPKGVWKLLDGFPGGLRSIEFVPPNTRALAALKFDLRKLDQRLGEVLAEIAPGTARDATAALERFFKRMGLDYRNDVLPALGDEIGLIVFEPPAGPVPDWVFGLDLNDVAAFQRMRPVIEQHLGGFQKVELREGLKGGQPAWPVPAVFTVAKRHWLGASSRKLLFEVLDEWGEKTLAKHGATFQRTLRGMTGGEKADIVGLAYLDLKEGLPAALSWADMLPARDFEDFIDPNAMPDPLALTERLAGMGVCLRASKRGLTLDVYSPVGVVALTPILWVRTVKAWR